MPDHAIGTIIKNTVKDDPNKSSHNLNIIRVLSENEYQDLASAQQTLNQFVEDSQLFMIVAWNLNEFVGMINNYLASYIQKDLDIFESKQIYINLNRGYLNYLGSIRSYLDYFERLLKKRYGKLSVIVKGFKTRCSHEYDNNFSYRFLYKLRNYGQHKGFPIGSIDWGQKPSEANPSKADYFLDIYFSRDELLTDFDWGPIREEVKEQSDKINALPHTMSMMDSLSSIHMDTINDLFTDINESANQLLKTGKEVEGLPGTPVIVDFADDLKNIRFISHQLLRIKLARIIVEGSVRDLIRFPNKMES